ncbi:MAG TPA: PQQ-dependent sugar dehydrogenase, partial [Pilimelia sp.]|nr:PQQ-dependent sugar dehydrogenase [Pilimelia sp.]
MSRPLRRTVVAGVVALLAVGMVTGSRGGPATAAPVTYQAENATIFHGVVESEHTGYTGTGYVNSTNEVGAYVEWTFTPATAGSVTLRFRYANGVATNRTTSVMLNGASLPTLQFPSTGGWTSWEMQNEPASLSAGSNTVRVTATTAGGLANLDSLVVDDGQGGGGPISDPIPENPIASGLGLTLTQFGAQFPQTNPVPTPTDSRLMRRARVNYLGQIPGSSRLFVPDLNGRLYTLTSTGGTPSVYLDVRSRVGSNFFSGRGMGSGFGFVAFHPEFATNGRFYTTHSEAFDALGSITPDWTQSGADVHSVVTEWTATDPAAATFSGSRRTVLRIGFASYLHAIQQIDFNPTAAPGSPDYGMLYIAVGDGGTGYQNSQPQNMNMVHGKLLRIDPRGTNGINGRYGIPPSNPFVGRPNTRGEIYAVGFRDPHRFSWDTGEGNRLFLGNIGEHDVESIYDLRA